ncbi:hypothetical protein K1719_047308 [Acacia pycnantha]|nr:hypothetical protein K1719_047308 [Acacia pycnantha]
MSGLGLGSFGLDWNTVAGFLGSPLANPGFVMFNVLGGFFLFLYVVVPIAYWSNAYEAKKFPLFSSHTFDSTGAKYNVTRVLNQATFDIDLKEYNSYSKLHLSVLFALNYGLSFATLTATISHVVLFHGRNIYQMWRKTTDQVKGHFADVHTRIMKKNYEQVPEWWFISILITMGGLAFYACLGFGGQLQLPWWGILLSFVIAFVFTLPIGVIQATTNSQVGLNVITELIIGFIYPGKPLANVAFKTYGYISMAQALDFVSDFKLGHYMKIPPRSMFIVQLAGTVVASMVYFGTAWTTKNVHKDGNYPEMNWFFLIGLLAPVPVWLLSRKFPNQQWIPLVNMPIIFGGAGGLLPAKAVNYIMWGIVGVFFNIYVYSRFKGWWARHTYILSAALDAGVAFTGVLLFFTLQSYDIIGPAWWGLQGDDHCSLARCPTAPGVKGPAGCPIF